MSDCFKGQKCIPGFPGLVEVGTDPGSGKILRCCSHDGGLVFGFRYQYSIVSGIGNGVLVAKKMERGSKRSNKAGKVKGWKFF